MPSRLPMGVLAAVAEFERDLLIERTQAGLSRARASGTPLGRPLALSDADAHTAQEKLSSGLSVAAVAREYKTSRQTIMRIRDRVIQ